MGSFHVLREVAICERHDTDVAVNFLEDDYQRSCNRCIRWSVGALYHVHPRSTQRAIIDGCPVGGVFRATKSAQNETVLGGVETSVTQSGLDSIFTNGRYKITGTSTSTPVNDWGICFVFRHNSGISHQVKICANNNAILYRKSLDGTYGDWQTIEKS